MPLAILNTVGRIGVAGSGVATMKTNQDWDLNPELMDRKGAAAAQWVER